MRPLTEMAALVSAIESHDLSERLAWGGADDELSRLCASFDRLLDRLQAVFERQRRFIADASHELRGPLAVIRAETELALKKPRSSPEYCAALQTVRSETDELTGLVDDLLAAARVESQPSAPAIVGLGQLIDATVSRMNPLAASRDVTIRVHSAFKGVVKTNPADLERAIVALLDNATRHAAPSGFVDVHVGAEDGHVSVSVEDDGGGFSPEGLQYATDRFWRDDAARGNGRSGLGLAIVKAVVERFGGKLLLENAATGGARVTMYL
jgi:two-component system, OmpR family, sensor kinase